MSREHLSQAQACTLLFFCHSQMASSSPQAKWKGEKTPQIVSFKSFRGWQKWYGVSEVHFPHFLLMSDWLWTQWHRAEIAFLRSLVWKMVNTFVMCAVSPKFRFPVAFHHWHHLRCFFWVGLAHHLTIWSTIRFGERALLDFSFIGFIFGKKPTLLFLSLSLSCLYPVLTKFRVSLLVARALLSLFCH